MVGVPQATQGCSTGGEGLMGLWKSGKSAAAGLQAGAWGKRGWAQLASMSSSSGTGRDALPATCQRDPDTPHACARPAETRLGSSLLQGLKAAAPLGTSVRGLGCAAPAQRPRGCPGRGRPGRSPPVGPWPAVLEEKAPGPGDRRNLWLFLAWLAARGQVGAAGLHRSPRAVCRANTVPCQPFTCCRRAERVGARGWHLSAWLCVGSCQHSDNWVPESPTGTRGCHQPRCSHCTDITARSTGCTQSPNTLQGSELRAASSQGAAQPRGHAGQASFCPWGSTGLRALSGISAGSGRNAAAVGTMRHLAPILSVTRSGAAARAQPRAQGAGRMQMEMTPVAVSCGRMRPAFSSSAPDAEPGALGGSVLCPLPIT